jgi:xylulose-5-phosphate/fructose-6-phosphate phosphoketolase
MPGEVFDRPNLQPAPSNAPGYVSDLTRQARPAHLSEEMNPALQKYRRVFNYIAVATIFRRDDAYIEGDLNSEDIKPRLLGHWGTCSGLALVYSHVSLLIQKHNLDMLYIVGPGHGAASTIAKFYPECSHDTKALTRLITALVPLAAFPFTSTLRLQGAIHEGRELGYALSVSFGAFMDNPDMIVTCIVGDGKSDTGHTATVWHGYKFIDPAESEAVLPIVYVDGFKISEGTILSMQSGLSTHSRPYDCDQPMTSGSALFLLSIPSSCKGLRGISAE